MIVVEKLESILDWSNTVFPWLQDVMSAITWDTFTYLFPASVASLFSIFADAFIVFVCVGLFKKLFVGLF